MKKTMVILILLMMQLTNSSDLESSSLNTSKYIKMMNSDILKDSEEKIQSITQQYNVEEDNMTKLKIEIDDFIQNKLMEYEKIFMEQQKQFDLHRNDYEEKLKNNNIENENIFMEQLKIKDDKINIKDDKINELQEKLENIQVNNVISERQKTVEQKKELQNKKIGDNNSFDYQINLEKSFENSGYTTPDYCQFFDIDKTYKDSFYFNENEFLNNAQNQEIHIQKNLVNTSTPMNESNHNDDDTSSKKNTSSPKSKSNCFKIYNVLNEKKENQTRDNLCSCMKMNTCLDDHYKYNNFKTKTNKIA